MKNNTNTWTRVISGTTSTRINYTDQQCSLLPYDFRVRAKNAVDGPLGEVQAITNR